VRRLQAIDALGAVLQQAVTEAAGGDAAVEADPPLHLDRPCLQCRQQLLAAAGDEAWWRLHMEFQIGQDLRARFVEQLIAAAHLAGADQLLRLLAAGGQAAPHQFQIKTLPAGHGPPLPRCITVRFRSSSNHRRNRTKSERAPALPKVAGRWRHSRTRRDGPCS
jgi:hypothetical protein